MLLDTSTLRVALAVVDLTLLLLFYFSTYRRTRSTYSGWWCLALLLFLAGNAAYLLNGTVQQWWANSSGNVLLVSGAAGSGPGPVRCGPSRRAVGIRRSLPRSPPWRPWWTTRHQHLGRRPGLPRRHGPDRPGLQGAVPAGARLFAGAPHRAVGAGILAAFYFGRFIAFVTDGPAGPVFGSVFGSATTTVFSAVILVVASFTMAELS